MKYILVLHEKHGDRYIAAGDTDESIGKVATAVVLERLHAEYWYTEPHEIQSALHYLDRNKAMSWLRSRSTYEYEGVSVQTLEILE